jgi:tetratricopeptide (TPR) repeat protein
MTLILSDRDMEWRSALKREGLILVAVIGLLILASCSSPAVTGIKVHIQNGEYQEAVHLADSVIASGEGVDAELWIWRGKAMGNMRDWRGAAESFTAAWRLDPAVSTELSDFWYVYYNTAALDITDGNTTAAIAMLEEGRMIVPSRPEYDMMLGDIALNGGDLEEALNYFEASWQLSIVLIAGLETEFEEASDPAVEAWLAQTLDGAVVNGILSLYNAGTISRSLSGTTEDETEKAAYIDGAMVAFETALDYDPANTDILTAIAELHLLNGEFELALGVFDQALLGVEQGVSEGWLSQEEADEMVGNIKLTRGFALLEMGEYEQAIAELNETLELIGRSYAVMANIAHAFFQMEKYEESLDYLNEIVSMTGVTSENLAYAHYMRFACHLRLEEDETAASALETALEYQPDNADYWEYLASTYSRLGRRTEAVNAMQRAEDIRNNQ